LCSRSIADAAPKVSLDGVEEAHDLNGRVLFIGFGRFAQVVSQSLLARGVDISLIETDVEMIQVAANFGFKVYYGDGTRLDVLRASGAGTAEAILVCVDKPESDRSHRRPDQIRIPAREDFCALVRSRPFDALGQVGVDYQIRELFESSLTFSGAVLRDLGFSDFEIAETIEDVRERDAERFEMQLAGGIEAGRGLWRNNTTTPKPSRSPCRAAKAGRSTRKPKTLSAKPKRRDAAAPVRGVRVLLLSSARGDA
jgi:glutathione-regulated potassium-efflux system protein KefB